jgi:LysM repeat protein
LIAAVNALRASNGLPPYNSNSILMQVAQSHADYMAATGNTTHYSADGSRPFQRALAAGYPVAGDLSRGGWFSENIQSGSGLSPSGAVTAWQGDAPHLNTMLSANLFDVGAGVSKNGNSIYYVLDAGASGSSTGNPGLPGTVVAPGTPLVSQFIVPVTLNTPGPDGYIYHEVQYGQTLWSIAIAYETKIDAIKALNNLAANDIQPGQKLLVLKGPTPAAVTETPTPEATFVQPTKTIAAPATSAKSATATDAATVKPVVPQEGGGNIALIIITGALSFAVLGTWLGTRKQI